MWGKKKKTSRETCRQWSDDENVSGCWVVTVIIPVMTEEQRRKNTYTIKSVFSVFSLRHIMRTFFEQLKQDKSCYVSKLNLKN